MEYSQHFSLQHLTTFKTPGFASHFFSFKNEEELTSIVQRNDFERISNHYKDILVLGKGSNLLLLGNVNGVVLKNEIDGLKIIEESADDIFIEVGAGMDWHHVVLHAIENGWAGIENLALIPGTAGAAPVQNIGAYGVELKDVFQSLRCWHFEDNKWYQLGLDECQFGYRDSIFKRGWKNKTVITSVQFKLSKNAILNTEYGAIMSELGKMGILKPTILEVANAVMNIRNSKIPNPDLIPNAGSFFKNPTITDKQYEYLKIDYPEMPYYKLPDGYKIPAGWLLEKGNGRGYSEGGVGCYEKQALILINTGGAKGKDILAFSKKIQQSVREKFGIELEREVNLAGNLPS